jgi:hypothetical protein
MHSLFHWGVEHSKTKEDGSIDITPKREITELDRQILDAILRSDADKMASLIKVSL